MTFFGRITESAAATKTFGTLRVERRVLVTPMRSIAIDNIATISVGTHVVPKPRGFYWLLVLLFAIMTLGSMRPDFSFGPLAPTPFTALLGVIMLIFVVLALRPDDKTHYLLISSSDGILTRFTAPERAFLDEVRGILTDKINRGDEALTLQVNFEKAQIENMGGAHEGRAPAGSAPSYTNGAAGPVERSIPQAAPQRSRTSLADASHVASRPSRGQPSLGPMSNGAAAPITDSFVDYSTVLPAIVEMHRFYARQPGTQHLEQRLSELELLMRAGTPTSLQKSRLKELSGEMSQILQAYPQAVELFDHIGGLVV